MTVEDYVKRAVEDVRRALVGTVGSQGAQDIRMEFDIPVSPSSTGALNVASASNHNGTLKFTVQVSVRPQAS